MTRQTSPANPSMGFSIADWDAEEQAEFWASLSLRHCKGIGLRFAAKLLTHFGGARKAVACKDEWPRIGLPVKLVREFSSGRWENEAKKEWDIAAKLRSRIILWQNPAYPDLLKEIVDCPIFLYFSGDPNLLHSPAIALVGSRSASPANLDITRQLASDLSSQGITVVSGMAMGIDTAAHEGALPYPGKSIGVLGTGIKTIYPWCNRQLFEQMEENGLLLSEFEPNSPPIATHFPIRNRIISGLSLGVVVVEAAEKSGSLITARMALEQNREIFAIPGPAFNSRSLGCQNLLRSGAHPVFSTDDIIRELRPLLKTYLSPDIQQPPAQKPRQAELFNRPEPVNFKGKEVARQIGEEDDSSKVLSCLRQNGRLHIDEIVELAELDLDVLSPLLISMELLGQIIHLPGGFYEAGE